MVFLQWTFYRSYAIRSYQKIDLVTESIFERDANLIIGKMFHSNQLLVHVDMLLVDTLQQRRLELGPDNATSLMMWWNVIWVVLLQ